MIVFAVMKNDNVEFNWSKRRHKIRQLAKEYSESIMTCDTCKIELVWHEGVYSGWVHSNDPSENILLNTKCQATELRREWLILMGFGEEEIEKQILLDPPVDVDEELNELESIRRIQSAS